MAVLLPAEYDIKYFNPHSPENTSGLSHLAGYKNYSKIQGRLRTGRFVPKEQSTGLYFGDLCKGLNINLNNRFVGKKLLVLGCAYGYEVEQFRLLGIDAWGIDCSTYAIMQAKPEVLPYLEVADARTKVTEYRRNEWDYIYSRWFMECMSDDDLQTLLPELGRVCKSDQVHIMSTFSPSLYYNIKTLNEWLLQPFTVGTILIVNDELTNYVVKINQ